MSERNEAFMRIVVGIVSGLILTLWKVLVQVMAVVNWFVVIFTAERSKDLANFCEMWNTQVYLYLKYMTFVSNTRPFPFNNMTKNMSKFEKK
jgi:hypothetical protein